jgi:hypothetical protein
MCQANAIDLIWISGVDENIACFFKWLTLKMTGLK